MTSFDIMPRRRPSGVSAIFSLTVFGGVTFGPGAALAGPPAASALPIPTPPAEPKSPAATSEISPKLRNRVIAASRKYSGPEPGAPAFSVRRATPLIDGTRTHFYHL